MRTKLRLHLEIYVKGFNNVFDVTDIDPFGSVLIDPDNVIAKYEKIELNGTQLEFVKNQTFGSALSVHVETLHEIKIAIMFGEPAIEVWSLNNHSGHVDDLPVELFELIPRLLELNANNVAFVNSMQLTKKDK